MSSLQPVPYQDVRDLPVSVQMWYNQIRQYVNSASGTIPWVTVSKAGANITDIPNRDHNNLLNIQGGTGIERYHLTAAQYALVGGTAPYTGSYASGTFALATGQYGIMAWQLILTGVQTATLAGTSTLRIV